MLHKTHTEEPRISVRMLADYMAASEQGQRTIARNCKYKPTVPVVRTTKPGALPPPSFGSVTRWS